MNTPQYYTKIGENNFKIPGQVYINLFLGVAALIFCAVSNSAGDELSENLMITFLIGPVALGVAFAQFGMHKPKEAPEKRGYKVARLILLGLVALAFIANLVPFFLGGTHFESIYRSKIFILSCLIALGCYIWYFKPSASKRWQKCLKAIGYSLILLVLNALSLYSMSQTPHNLSSYGNMDFSNYAGEMVLIIVGILLIVIGRKHD